MDLAGTLRFLAGQPLLALACAGIFLATLGGTMRRALPAWGRLVRGLGELSLVAALLLTMVQVARFSGGADVALPQLGLPAQTVAGGETRIPLSDDGHFWLRASVNGVKRRFLVDTGATVTAISPDLARAAALEPQPTRGSVILRTANGSTRAELTSIDELRFGNVVARDLDAVVAPGLGQTNVIGMNLLSRLASWRVEDNTLILTPRRGAPAETGS